MRWGVVSSSTLRQKRRIGYACVAVIAVALPGVDPVLTAIEIVPLLALYELTTLVARRLEPERPVEAEPTHVPLKLAS